MEPTISRRDVARALNEIARYLELSDDRFRSLAFAKAARQIDSLSEDLGELVDRNALGTIPGIGKAIGPMIEEMVRSGSIGYLEELRRQYPPGVLQMIRVPGFGLKKIRMVYERLGISSVEELARAAKEGRLRDLPGFGGKTEEKILEGLEFLEKQREKFHLYRALDAAAVIISRLESDERVESVVLSGAARRRLEVVEEIVICVNASDPDAAANSIEQNPPFDFTEREGPRLHGIGRFAIPVTLFITSPDQFWTSLFVSTGTEEFVARLTAEAKRKGFDLDAGGLRSGGKRIPLASEEELFAHLSVPYVEPELREDGTWAGATPPRLVHRADIRGTFHVHSTYSDGRDTLRDMLYAAAERGYDYVGISEHSQFAHYAGGLSPERLERAASEIDGLRPQFPSMKIFRGTEADILQDGSIDYGARVLSKLDFVIASIHSRFRMDREQMTERMVRALHDPFVTFLGHLSGRKLLTRDEYGLDSDAVFTAAAENGVIVEINGSPHRLDIDWRLMKRAMERGVMFSIHPDAHSTEELEYVLYGVWHARKGALPAEQIFNTRSLDEVSEYLAARRERAMERTATR